MQTGQRRHAQFVLRQRSAGCGGINGPGGDCQANRTADGANRRGACAERRAAVARYCTRPLTDARARLRATTPDLAVVGGDGGRLQILERRPAKAAGAGDASKPAIEESLPPDEKHRGTHWREDKIGLLLTMTSQVSATDPCPQVPTTFVDPTRIVKLTRELKTKRSAAEVATQQEAAQDTAQPEAAAEVFHAPLSSSTGNLPKCKPSTWPPPVSRGPRLVHS